MSEYLAAGVRLVWLVLTDQSEVYKYQSRRDVQVFTRDMVLDAEPVLPGFRLPLAQILPLPENPLSTDEP